MANLDRIDARALGGLVETLYSAVQNPFAWNDVVVRLCQYIGADSGCIRFYTSDWSRVILSATHAFDLTLDTAYREHYHQIDPISDAIRRSGRPSGTTAHLGELLPIRELIRTEFYNDYMRPQDKHHVLGGFMFQADGPKLIVGVQRSRVRRPFRSAEYERLTVLSSHFRQALRLTEILTEKESLVSAFDQVLDILNVAAFFLDQSGFIRYCNPVAETMLRDGKLVTIGGGKLVAVRRQQDTLLQTLIHASSSRDSTQPLPAAGGGLQLTPVSADRGEVTAIVVPWTSPSAFGVSIGPRIATAVFIGTRTQPDLERCYLIGAYGLTPTEARLVVQLVDKGKLERASEAIGVTRQTARAYLKSIFSKTNCRSQGELISMILNSPSGLWGRHDNSGTTHDQNTYTGRRTPAKLRRTH